MAKPKTKARVKAGTSKSAASIRKAMFVDAYIANGGNATEAAKKAGYSERSAHTTGYRLLKDAEAISMIDSRQADIAKKYQLTTENIIKSMAQELFFDPAKMLNADGTHKSILDMDEDTRMALSSVETNQIGGDDGPVIIRKIKWADRSKVREQAMKYLGMFQRDNEQVKPDALDEVSSLEIARRVAFILRSGAQAKGA